MALWLLASLLLLCVAGPSAFALGRLGHRTVAAIAMLLIPEKAGKMTSVLAQLEIDGNFVDAARYPDVGRRSDPRQTRLFGRSPQHPRL